MRYKNIAAIGGTLITIFSILSGLMYYYSHDTCPAGTFLCKNTTDCMQQKYWCNQEINCPYGDDEGEDCFDDHWSWDWFRKERNWQVPVDLKCDANDAPVGCTYSYCNAHCIGYSDIPQNLSSDIVMIDLSNNSITKVAAGALAPYTNVVWLCLDNNDITELEKGAFANQGELFWLVLASNKIRIIEPGHLIGLTKLETLKINKNRIVEADFSDLKEGSIYWIDLNENLLTSTTLVLSRLPSLTEIYLNDNHFENIPESLFAGCPALQTLSIRNNYIRTIDENAFKNLEHLVEVNLEENEIKVISANVFRYSTNITSLSLGYNPIKNFAIELLEPLTQLRSLALEDINMDAINKNAFEIFPQLDFAYFNKFHYCTTYAPKVKKCVPASDGVSSLSHLLHKPLLRIAVWIISCATCMGNMLVLWGRFTSKDEDRVLTIVIRSLAVSDMLMGVYLFIIAVADLQYRDIYNLAASSWMSSWSCTFSGILAMTSSEVSVLILSFMSVERFMVIAAPLKGHRAMTPHTAFASMIVIWIIGITLALAPAIHWRSSTRFYGVNGMCFPLHIDDPYLIGWEYSAFIFLGLNLLGLITIGYVYAGMFASIWKTRHATPLAISDSEFALRFFLIVFTDAACWAPIIALKIRALMKYPVSADLHAWIVVFILPVNSAVNPLLYTFTTLKFRERLSNGWFAKIRNHVTRRHSAHDSQVSTTVSLRNTSSSISCGYNGEKKVPPIFKFNSEKAASEKHDHVL